MDRDKTIFKSEKPLVGRRFAVENIGNADDKSLFGLVARHWPNMDARGKQTAWLVCDDGAMESVDFIHLDETCDPPELALIHVKGSGSGEAKRDLSVSDYEVVVGQAVKNLRHIDRGLLGDKLAANAAGYSRMRFGAMAKDRRTESSASRPEGPGVQPQDKGRGISATRSPVGLQRDPQEYGLWKARRRAGPANAATRCLALGSAR